MANNSLRQMLENTVEMIFMQMPGVPKAAAKITVHPRGVVGHEVKMWEVKVVPAGDNFHQPEEILLRFNGEMTLGALSAAAATVLRKLL